MRHVYYVVYVYNVLGNIQHGCGEFGLNKQIDSIEDVKQLAEMITAKHNNRGVMVTNFVLLRKEKV